MVDLLVRSGTDKAIVNEDGQAAVDVVEQSLLENYGRDYEYNWHKPEGAMEIVRDLLEYAPADRADRAARRLRVYLVLTPTE